MKQKILIGLVIVIIGAGFAVWNKQSTPLIDNVFTPGKMLRTLPVEKVVADAITLTAPELTLEQEIAHITENCRTAFQDIYGGAGDCEVSDAFIAFITETYDIEAPNPSVKGDCYESTEKITGTDSYSTGILCPYHVPPTSYTTSDSPALVDAALTDPRAALEVSRRSPDKKQKIGWLLHAAAISPDPQKASGPLMRIAQKYMPARNIKTGKVNMDTVIRRLTFEEMAAERGNPLAQPDHWWGLLEETFPVRMSGTRLLVDRFKETMENSLTKRRAEHGFPNA